MNLLGIDTSTEACTVAVMCEGRLESDNRLGVRHHATALLSMIDEILQKTGLTLNALDAIALGIGPGAFTGLRIGVSVAQGLAFALSKPIIPISSLSVLAQTAYRKRGETQIQALLDARMQEVYVGEFVVQGEQARLVGSEVICSVSSFQAKATHFLVGPGAIFFTDQTQQGDAGIFPDAADLCYLASLSFAQAISPAELVVNYLRNQVIQVP